MKLTKAQALVLASAANLPNFPVSGGGHRSVTTDVLVREGLVQRVHGDRVRLVGSTTAPTEAGLDALIELGWIQDRAEAPRQPEPSTKEGVAR